MLSKEELLKYKFELEVAYDGLGRGLDIADVKDAISLGIVGYEKMLNLLFNPKPYKLEDLKEDMLVWDDIEKLICQIGLISKNAIHRKYIDGTISDSPFEEKRFFPVQYANLIKMGVKDDGTQKSTDD
jgi:hypothetical protein